MIGDRKYDTLCCSNGVFNLAAGVEHGMKKGYVEERR